MMQLVSIGIGAGLAAALLFASLVGGTSLAFPLFCATGVPIAIAGFGWRPLAGFIAALTAAAALFVVVSPPAAGTFLLLFGLPIAWCVRLALLSRTTEDDGTEWYPYGRLLMHATVAAAAGVVICGAMVGYSAESFGPPMTDALQAWFASHPDLQVPPNREEIEAFVRLNLRFWPYAFGAIALVIIVLDLWLGALVARKSGRLTRPEEPVWTVMLPVQAALAFIVVLALSFLPAPLGDVAAVLTGATACAFALVGLAVLHAVTMGNNQRRLLLFGTYFLLVFFGFPILLFAVLGLAETLFHLRARRFRGSPPTP
jgi:hypothetical protein